MATRLDRLYARAFFGQAVHDLEDAEALIAAPGGHWAGTVKASQAACEKALKARIRRARERAGLTVVRHTSNNSGGLWWLDDEHWKALEAAGWQIEWFKDNPHYPSEDGRFLGALAAGAERVGLSREAAIEEFERITGQNAEAEACGCCGPPHYFSEE